MRGCARAECSAAALRHFVFNTHYRKELNLSDEALEASHQAVRRVGDFADRLYDPATLRWAGRRSWRRRRTRRWRQAEAALFDDLNAPGGAGGAVQLHPAGERRARPAGWRPRVGRAGAGGVRADQRRAGHRAGSGGATIRSWRRGSRSGSAARRAARDAARFCRSGPHSRRARRRAAW